MRGGSANAEIFDDMTCPCTLSLWGGWLVGNALGTQVYTTTELSMLVRHRRLCGSCYAQCTVNQEFSERHFRAFAIINGDTTSSRR
jgi:hypothetical protein